MQQPVDKGGRFRGWGVPASVAAHVLVVALLIFGLPLPQVEPEEPVTIAVELVPPPEPEQAEQEPPPEAEPAPEEPAPEEQAQEAPPPPEESAGDEQASAPPIQVLRPVFEFGEQDTGPRETRDGNASAEAESEETALEPAPERVDAASAPVPAQKPPLQLTEARTLFSRAVTNDPAAMTAMGTLPRGVRAAELCATELREQLRHATPPYRPELLPAYRLGSGTQLVVRDGAFRAGGQWFNLTFRCDVDAAATRVVSFAFTVGAPIPRGEWRVRGFPDS